HHGTNRPGLSHHDLHEIERRFARLCGCCRAGAWPSARIMIPVIKRGLFALPLSILDGISRCQVNRHVPGIRNAFGTVCSFCTWSALMAEQSMSSADEIQRPFSSVW